jgi:hypothetical protein
VFFAIFKGLERGKYFSVNNGAEKCKQRFVSFLKCSCRLICHAFKVAEFENNNCNTMMRKSEQAVLPNPCLEEEEDDDTSLINTNNCCCIS